VIYRKKQKKTEESMMKRRKFMKKKTFKENHLKIIKIRITFQ